MQNQSTREMTRNRILVGAAIATWLTCVFGEPACGDAITLVVLGSMLVGASGAHFVSFLPTMELSKRELVAAVVVGTAFLSVLASTFRAAVGFDSLDAPVFVSSMSLTLAVAIEISNQDTSSDYTRASDHMV